uniref:Spt4/RpoE2 zinc finger domain-containing protein n=1 Tax=Timema shepardi TaxID=629360 RepID=A0A7R9G1S1_TIMSH|nr:unnamed protein product [Timema shepardi]
MACDLRAHELRVSSQSYLYIQGDSANVVFNNRLDEGLIAQCFGTGELGSEHQNNVDEACSTFDQFEFDGCENCDEFLRMKNNRDNVYDCTSSNFDGFCKGVYAISVSGRLPATVIREMKSRGLVYRPRDTSQR